MYASWYFARLFAVARSGLRRRTIAGVVGVAMAWWIAGALPAFEGGEVISAPDCRAVVIPAPCPPSQVCADGGSVSQPRCAPSPWLPIWPPGQIIAAPGAVNFSGIDPGPVPGMVPAALPGSIPRQDEPNFSFSARAVTPP
jgi:hypothetical protein